MDYLLKTSRFMKVQDICGVVGQSVIIFQNAKELVKKFVSDIDETGLLVHLSHIHILVGTKNDETFLRPGEKTWSDLLDDNEELKKTMDELGCVILGYVLTSDDRYVERIDTFLRGFDIASFMIDKLNEARGTEFIPSEITESSAGYWRQYYDLWSNEEIDNFIKEYKINKKDIDWRNLYW